MEVTEVSLGRGIARDLSSNLIDEKAVPIEKIWNTLEDFGIKRNELKLAPSYKELYEIYSVIRAYRKSIRYLKELNNSLQK
jgi:collagenase-like PrtC family protease